MQTIGGKSSSSSSSSGSGTTNVSVSAHEIGEVIQVPANFVSDSYVDAGSMVDKASFPDLYNRLTDGAYGTQWTAGAALPAVSPTESSATTTPLNYVVHGSQVIMALRGGIFVGSTDGLTFNYLGTLPNDNLIPNSLLFTSVSLFYSNGSRIVFGCKAYSAVYLYYSDDAGVTWNRFSSPVLEAAMSATYAGAFTPRNRDVLFDGTNYLLFNLTAKTTLRSSDLLTWTETAFTSNMLNTSYLVWAYNPTTKGITIINNQKTFYSSDSGATWTETAFALTGSSLSNIIQNPFDNKLYMSNWYSSGSTYYQLVWSSADGKAFTQTASLSSSAASCTLLFLHGTYMVLCGSSFTVNAKAYYAAQSAPASWTVPAAPSIGNTSGLVYSFGGNICFPGTGSNGYAKIYYMTGPAAGAYLTGPSSFNLFNTQPSMSGKSASDGNMLVALLSTTNATTDYLYSTDGYTWTKGSFPYAGLWTDVAWDWVAGKFYVISSSAVNGDAKNYLTSTDGINWVLNTGKYTCTGNYLLVTDTYVAFCTAGASGGELIARTATKQREYAQSVSAYTLYSNPIYDGTNLLLITTNSTNTLYGLTDPGITSYSFSRTITSQTTGVLGAQSDSVLAYVNGNACIYSADATYTVWNSSTLPVNTTWGAFLCLNGMFVLIPKTGTLGLMSKDCVTWATFKLAGLPKNLTVLGARVYKSMIILLTSGGNCLYVSDTSKSSKRLVQFSSPGITGLKNVVRAK